MRFITNIAVSMAVAYTIAGCGGSKASGDKTQAPSTATEDDVAGNGSAEEQGKHGLVGAATNALSADVDKCRIKTGELESQITSADALIKTNEAAMKAFEKEISICRITGEELAAAPAKLALELEEKAIMDLPDYKEFTPKEWMLTANGKKINMEKAQEAIEFEKLASETRKTERAQFKQLVNGENPNAGISKIAERLAAITQELSDNDGPDAEANSYRLQQEFTALHKKLEAYVSILAEKPNRKIKTFISTLVRTFVKQSKKTLEERRRILHAWVYGHQKAGHPVPKALSDELAIIHEQMKQIESVRF